jgi:hypothetical protein
MKFYLSKPPQLLPQIPSKYRSGVIAIGGKILPQTNAQIARTDSL